MDDASVQSRILCETLGIFNMHRQQEMAQRIEWTAKADQTSFEQARIKMVNAWLAYKAARPNLRWAFAGAVKFFESDIWIDDGLWPWNAPTSASIGVYSGQGMSDEEAAAVRERIAQKSRPVRSG